MQINQAWNFSSCPDDRCLWWWSEWRSISVVKQSIYTGFHMTHTHTHTQLIFKTTCTIQTVTLSQTLWTHLFFAQFSNENCGDLEKDTNTSSGTFKTSEENGFWRSNILNGLISFCFWGYEAVYKLHKTVQLEACDKHDIFIVKHLTTARKCFCRFSNSGSVFKSPRMLTRDVSWWKQEERSSPLGWKVHSKKLLQNL